MWIQEKQFHARPRQCLRGESVAQPVLALPVVGAKVKPVVDEMLGQLDKLTGATAAAAATKKTGHEVASTAGKVGLEADSSVVAAAS